MDVQQDNERVMGAALPGTTLTEQVVVGEQVEEMLESPGFKALAEAIRVNREATLDRLMFRKAEDNAAAYADLVGHMRGSDEVFALARGLAQNGKDAAETRRLEEEMA